MLLGSKAKQTRRNQRDTKPSFLQPSETIFGWMHSDSLGSGVLVINKWVKAAQEPRRTPVGTIS